MAALRLASCTPIERYPPFVPDLPSMREPAELPGTSARAAKAPAPRRVSKRLRRPSQNETEREGPALLGPLFVLRSIE
jgi:hypothetical protein